MLKKILALITMLYAAATFAAVDVNKASAADLDGVKGIGPSISSKILEERKKGNFKDWNDFIERVKGVGEGNAAKFSAEGLTVNGAGFKGAAAAPAAKKDEKPMAKAEERKADVKPAAAAPATPTPAAANVPAVKEEKKDPKAEAKAKKEADKKAKAEEKQKKADEAKAKKEAASKGKDDKKDAKADAAKPAASAAKK
ncbi:MAG: helix-hairpin-helix domain-containing protein [Rhodoferax sp.]|nr:helix-hairpin-helix domain-containing protein [Rhodoferax sp.]